MHGSDPSPRVKLAIEVLGGPVAAARVLGVKGGRYQTVQSWLANRVPAEYCPLIERETRLKAAEANDPNLIVTCEQLRPDVQWSVLRAQAAA